MFHVMLFCGFLFVRIRLPPSSTRTDTSVPTRRSSDLDRIVTQCPPRLAQRAVVLAQVRAVGTDVRGQPPVVVDHQRHAGFPAQRQQGHRLFARTEEHTSELQSLMRISYAVFCLKKKTQKKHKDKPQTTRRTQYG